VVLPTSNRHLVVRDNRLLLRASYSEIKVPIEASRLVKTNEWTLAVRLSNIQHLRGHVNPLMYRGSV